MNSNKDEITNNSSMEKVEDADRRRSKSGGKRRSGFSRGRISLTQLSKDPNNTDDNLAGSELYKQIPVDLPASQRLSLLMRLGLRHALEVLDREFEDVTGFDDFRVDAIKDVGDKIDSMESDGSFEQACTTPSLAPNPVNTQMETTISELKASIGRMQKEDGEWDDLVSKLESQASNAKEQLSQLNIEFNDIPEDIKELSSSFLPNQADTLDLTSHGADTVRDVKMISLLMDDYCHTVNLLDMAHCAASKHMNEITESLDQVITQRRCDPKEIIQQMLAS